MNIRFCYCTASLHTAKHVSTCISTCIYNIMYSFSYQEQESLHKHLVRVTGDIFLVYILCTQPSMWVHVDAGPLTQLCRQGIPA